MFNPFTSHELKTVSGEQFRLFPVIMAAFVACLLISNVIAVKVITIGDFFFDGGTVFFPLVYIFGDILTEVYGYARSRMVIWTGFALNILMAFMFWLVGVIPGAPGAWDSFANDAYGRILGMVPRIVMASLIAYFCGEFINSYVLSRLKIWTKGKNLWIRTISSTVLGEGVDTVIFVTIAFYHVIPNSALITMIVSNYIFKTLYEIGVTPITYIVVNFLKKFEKVDHYDVGANYNPFHITVDTSSEVKTFGKDPRVAPNLADQMED
jgi:hypothetical protein